MEQLNIDTGIREFCINGQGVLRFNPSDPNLYGRFLQAMEEIQSIEEEMVRKGNQNPENGKKMLDLILQADKSTKQQLTNVFGNENDFNQLLSGVNLMAVCENGERVITNLFAALSPILEGGTESFLKAKADKVRQDAKKRREAQAAV